MRNIEGQAITMRFFKAVDLLRDSANMDGGLKAFAERHKINRGNLSAVRCFPEQRTLKPEIIKWLCEDYGVNINYIMFAQLPIFNDSSQVQLDSRYTAG